MWPVLSFNYHTETERLLKTVTYTVNVVSFGNAAKQTLLVRSVGPQSRALFLVSNTNEKYSIVDEEEKRTRRSLLKSGSQKLD